MHSGQHKGTIDILGVVSSNRHKSQALISESPYHFAGQDAEISNYVKTCLDCQQAKRCIDKRHAPLRPLPTGDVFSRLHIDILGPLPKSEKGYKYILLITCAFSKWPEAFPMYTMEATEIADIIYREIICRYDAPTSLLSDRGRNFMSKLIKELCKIFQITKVETSSYHPQTNAACERMNSSILQTLRIYCDKNQTTWPKFLPSIMKGYRVSPATQSTQYSPHYLVFGREPKLPIDTALLPPAIPGKDAQAHLNEIISQHGLARAIAKENIAKAKMKYKTQHDKKAAEPEFRIGQNVWLYCSATPVGLNPKLLKRWVGPYYITQVNDNYTYKLNRCEDHKPIKSMVHANRLKAYHDPVTRPQNIPVDEEVELNPEEILDTEGENPQTVERNATDSREKEQETNQNNSNAQELTPEVQNPRTEIDKIISSSLYNGKRIYKVKWKNIKNTTWENTESLPQKLVQEFHISKTQTGRTRKRRLNQSQLNKYE